MNVGEAILFGLGALASALTILVLGHTLASRVATAITSGLAGCVRQLSSSVDRQATAIDHLSQSVEEHRSLARGTHRDMRERLDEVAERVARVEGEHEARKSGPTS